MKNYILAVGLGLSATFGQSAMADTLPECKSIDNLSHSTVMMDQGGFVGFRVNSESQIKDMCRLSFAQSMEGMGACGLARAEGQTVGEWHAAIEEACPAGLREVSEDQIVKRDGAGLFLKK